MRRHGYSAFSYADLAVAVGIRKASIHHHFPTKADLAAALVAAYDIRYDAALADVASSHIDWLQTVITDGQLNGTVRTGLDPASHARMIVATLEGALMMERVLAGAAGFRRVLDALCDGLKP